MRSRAIVVPRRVSRFFASLIAIVLGAPALLAQVTFTNSTTIQMPASPSSGGLPSLYPAVVAVSGISTPVTKVRVRFNSMSVTSAPRAMLIGPNGRQIALLSGVSGGLNGTITFDDTDDPTITPGMTLIQRLHIVELRIGTK